MSDDEELLEQQLVEDIASFTHDPHGYALYAFPWGEEEPSCTTPPGRVNGRVKHLMRSAPTFKTQLPAINRC